MTLLYEKSKTWAVYNNNYSTTKQPVAVNPNPYSVKRSSFLRESLLKNNQINLSSVSGRVKITAEDIANYSLAKIHYLDKNFYSKNKVENGFRDNCVQMQKEISSLKQSADSTDWQAFAKNLTNKLSFLVGMKDNLSELSFF